MVPLLNGFAAKVTAPPPLTSLTHTTALHFPTSTVTSYHSRLQESIITTGSSDESKEFQKSSLNFTSVMVGRDCCIIRQCTFCDIKMSHMYESNMSLKKGSLYNIFPFFLFQSVSEASKKSGKAQTTNILRNGRTK